jgi:hypothetical protein
MVGKGIGPAASRPSATASAAPRCSRIWSTATPRTAAFEIYIRGAGTNADKGKYATPSSLGRLGVA